MRRARRAAVGMAPEEPSQPPAAETTPGETGSGQPGHGASSTGDPTIGGRAATPDPAGTLPSARRPIYPRLLRLQHVHPNAWQRALLGEGALAAAALLVMADLATAWTLVVLPLGVAGFVKSHDLLAGLLERRTPAS